MNIGRVLSKLSEKDFELISLNDFDEENVSIFKKDHIAVILRFYHSELDKDVINKEARFYRTVLHKNNINVWNTYFIIVTEKEVTHEEMFIIERDSKSIRRYIVSNDNDFTRIPFLDDTDIVQTPLHLTNIIDDDQNVLMTKINDFIKKNSGETGKIKNSVISNNINSLINLEDI